MREKIRDKGRLMHMLDAAHKIVSYKDSQTFDEFAADPIRLYGFMKLVEIIGEAVYKLTTEFKATHTDIDWKAIEGMRHVLVHGYYTVMPKVLWNTMHDDIPGLIPILEHYIEAFDQ